QACVRLPTFAGLRIVSPRLNAVCAGSKAACRQFVLLPSPAQAVDESVKQANASGMNKNASRKGAWLTKFLMVEVLASIKQASSFPRLLNCVTAGLNEGKKRSGEAPSPGFRSWFLYLLPTISPASQADSPHAQIASNSRNGVSFSSARTTKRFPSSRCASGNPDCFTR